MFFYFVDSFSINYTDSVLNWKHVESYFLEEGFIEVSQADLSRAISFDVYKAQIASENTGGMAFLKKHLNQKKPPHKTHKTAFVALFPYFPYEDELKSHLKVAYYAKTQDYHKSLEMKLDSIVSKLKKTYPKETFDFAVDSKPYLERDLAYKAGLGWVGKNTCLINKKKRQPLLHL